MKLLKSENETLWKTVKDLNDEQENLLCLLLEMEVKCKKYAKVLKKYDYEGLEEDEEEDDDDDDDDEDEDEDDDKPNGHFDYLNSDLTQ